MTARAPCPPPERLAALHRGEFGSDVLALAAVCDHLSACPDCEARLAAIQESVDDVVPVLRRFAGRETAVDSAECRKLESDAKAFGPGGAGEPSEATSPGHFPLPFRLGKYELTEMLGRGGMGVVYRAVHTNLNRLVAVKVILPEFADHPRAVARFRREVRVLGELVHTNIVTATDADAADGHHFLVMELVEGEDLESLVRRSGPLPVGVACEVVRQAAVGLQHIHEKGRVHRDLKPSNLMLSSAGVVKILDLGLAALRVGEGAAGEDLTGHQQVMGTADYMAPEQWADIRAVDIRVDVYALGCTLHKLLTGRVPFGGSQYALGARKQIAHAEAPRPSVRATRADVPEELDAVVQKMMARAPGERFATPGEAAAALAPFAADVSVWAELPRPGGSTRPWGASGEPEPPAETRTHLNRTRTLIAPPARWRRYRWPAAVALLLLSAGLLGWALTREPKPIEDVKRQPEDPVPQPQPKIELPRIPEDKGPQPKEWYPVLRRDPARLYFPNPAGDNLVTPRPEANRVHVVTSSTALLGLGRADWAGGYRFRVGIRQTRWSGGAGVFIGYHPADINGRPVMRFQYFELRPGPKGEFTLTRARMNLNRAGDRLSMGDASDIVATSVGPLTDDIEHTLMVEVRTHGLTVVTWNGVELRRLTQKEHNDCFSPADYLGEFGTYSCQSQTWFGNAELMLFDRRP